MASADVIEDLEIGLSWMIRVSPKGIHMDLYKRKAEGEAHWQKRRHGWHSRWMCHRLGLSAGAEHTWVPCSNLRRGPDRFENNSVIPTIFSFLRWVFSDHFYTFGNLDGISLYQHPSSNVIPSAEHGDKTMSSTGYGMPGPSFVLDTLVYEYGSCSC